jgi:hypothetical protein
LVLPFYSGIRKNNSRRKMPNTTGVREGKIGIVSSTKLLEDEVFQKKDQKL